jgi:hypothetical protein
MDDVADVQQPFIGVFGTKSRARLRRGWVDRGKRPPGICQPPSRDQRVARSVASRPRSGRIAANGLIHRQLVVDADGLHRGREARLLECLDLGRADPVLDAKALPFGVAPIGSVDDRAAWYTLLRERN